MQRTFFFLLFLASTLPAFSQECADFVNDSSFTSASISFIVADAEKGDTIINYYSGRSLTPASIMKLITSAAALELLGPEHTFSTSLGYTGTISKSGKLNGDIVITGGGDPAFASPNFPDYYKEFPNGWADEVRKLGIRKIKGRVITDDSYYDYLPVPAKWLWEDTGNYYGAGAYGASVFDNTYEIHFKTYDSCVITGIVPEYYRPDLTNYLTASGTTDKGYVFAAPYATSGWLSGSIPADKSDFVLKAAITDPPLLIAGIVDEKLRSSGIKITGEPTTKRLTKTAYGEVTTISALTSPPLDSIIRVLNHESINLYAEHLLKELGKKFRNNGSTDAGLQVVYDFLRNIGVDTEGMFIVDGSGLSRANSINSAGLITLLKFMKNHGRYFPEYLNSLPDAGREGTLKKYFKDEAFNSSMKAKSGSMGRVKSYAGYLTTKSGNTLIFSMIVNNFTCPPARVNQLFEEVLKEVINNK
jgi:D-alanyl-D-alanine carboxypeptidase/D-alanyl-D-alanine-endopeptidase (penicillin-binding protein 4)